MPQNLKFHLTLCAVVVLLLLGCSKTDNTNSTETESTEKEKEKEPTENVENQVAFTELTLIDGVSTTAKPNHTVIIDTVKGTIIDVFASNAKTLNANLKVENMKGKTMMPGLIEGHYHLASGVEEDTKVGEISLKNMFCQGIKTVIDLEEVIESGEHGFLEFKSTMRWNLREARQDKKMEEIILKSIAAFSNSEGGKLLIGVADSGEILGLQEDYNTLKEANKDHFELHLRNIVNNAYGKDYATTYIEVNFPVIEESEICEINIKAGTKPLFLEVTDKNGQKHKKFFVRSGNSSQDLDIAETAEYVKRRFGNTK